MASLNTALTPVVTATKVEPADGLTDVTVGGVVSVPVVNDQLKSDARALPFASLTPLAPPFTRRCVGSCGARFAVGVSVAVVFAVL